MFYAFMVNTGKNVRISKKTKSEKFQKSNNSKKEV